MAAVRQEGSLLYVWPREAKSRWGASSGRGVHTLQRCRGVGVERQRRAPSTGDIIFLQWVLLYCRSRRCWWWGKLKARVDVWFFTKRCNAIDHGARYGYGYQSASAPMPHMPTESQYCFMAGLLHPPKPPKPSKLARPS